MTKCVIDIYIYICIFLLLGMPKKKQYLQESLDKAVGAVNSNKMSISKAAKEYGVPRTTISDHVNGKYDNHLNGPSKMLTDEEETSLINYVKYMSERGFPLTRRMLKAFVLSIVEKSGRKTLFNMDKGPSNKWINKLLNRHRELSEKLPEQQDKARRRMSNVTVVDQYFKLLSDTVDSLGLTNKPNQIFNCDESGFSGKEKSKEKVLTLKGSHSYQQKVMVHGHITVHMCIGADGHVLPSFIIFDDCLPHRNFKDGVPDTWLYGSSESGYMDTELFENWFDKVFLPFCGTRRPVLLIFDNHDSHISIDLIEKAKANNIHIIGLPPHTTHLLQPLDVAIFGPLKEKVNQLAVTVGNLNKSATIGKAKFPALLSTAIDQTLSLARVKESFRKSGMYPVDRSIIPNSQLAPADFHKTEKGNKEITDVDVTIITSNEHQESTILCHCCGNTLTYTTETELNKTTENPLVTKNLIPKSLADVLLPPANPSQAKKTSSKIVTEARVITGDEMLQKLQYKHDEAKKLEEEKEKRKTERARKKEEAEVLKEAKKEERERKKRDRELRDTEKEDERERKRQRKEEKRNKQSNQQITAQVHQYATCSNSSVDSRRSSRVKTPLIREEFLQFDSDIDIIETMEE
ncbi:uncharacterized protein LOC127717266 [Mytilus californianus]|uniref:uncharacterized protein LOC127717266 n=1 Tax=Mytilus californianus TaxID=6549 RepID=UPI00224519AC|nr:uncharacterized protein LOC127717266 [Mytilus californianus]